MKSLIESLEELAKIEGKKIERFQIKKKDMPNYDVIVKMIQAEKESERRALELKRPIGKSYVVNFYN